MGEGSNGAVVNTIGGRALVLALCVLSLTVTGGVALTGSTAAADGDAVRRIAPQQSDTLDDQNETPPHRNPDDYSEDGDLEGVEAWLTERLTNRLSEGAIELSEGEYDRAKGYVDAEYREQLDQYVDVAGQTEGESREAEFEEAGEQQARLTEAVQEYRETKAAYEDARRAGDDDRARELARELETLAAEIDSLGGSVRKQYETIETETGADLSEPETAVANVTEGVQAEQTVVRAQEFEETELTVTPERSEISFREPLIATGQVQTVDGEPIANEEIQLAINNHTERVTTDTSGAFTLEYRPTNESVAADTLGIRYVPATQSPYLGDETNVSVSIEQVDPTVSMTETSDAVSYETEAAVAGELSVDGVPVDGVPLAVVLDGERIGTVTVTDGTFDGTVGVPASVLTGERDLTVRLPFEDQALAPTTATTRVRVRETETSLSVDATPAGDRTLTITGTLRTADSEGISEEPVQFRIDGATVGTVTTQADGTFEDTVSVPGSMDEGDITLVAAYDESDSNLAPTDTETVVTLGTTGSGPSTTAWLAGGFLAVIAIGGGVWWFRRFTGEGSSSGDAAGDRGSTTDGPTAVDPAAESSPDAVESLFDQASEQLSRGQPDAAVQTGYAAVRRVLASQLDAPEALTHWEFYRTYRRTDAPDAELLYAVTEHYEHATFGYGGVSRDQAANSLTHARRLCGLDEQPEDGVRADDSIPADV